MAFIFLKVAMLEGILGDLLNKLKTNFNEVNHRYINDVLSAFPSILANLQCRLIYWYNLNLVYFAFISEEK